MEIIDLRPESDVPICINKMCINKCKKYYQNWKPKQNQSYINPGNRYDKNGIQKPCKLRID